MRSFIAEVHHDTIKLPPDIHLPDGTQVVVEARGDTIGFASPRGPMRTVPDFIARQNAAGMQPLGAADAERLDKLIAGEDA